jgi:SAM-dependent methyltransferase
MVSIRALIKAFLTDPLSLMVFVFGRPNGNILDVGCGDGSRFETIRYLAKSSARVDDVIVTATGIDAYVPSIKGATVYDERIIACVVALPLRDMSFDTALCTEVIEHLEKDKATTLLNELRRVAGRVILTTPNGHYQQHADINPMQEHKSFYTPSDFKRWGLATSGIGIRGFFGGEGFVNRIRFGIIRKVMWMMYIGATPLTSKWPRFCGQIIATGWDSASMVDFFSQGVRSPLETQIPPQEI